MPMILEFKQSEMFSMGVELELQLVNTRDHDLTSAAPDLLALLKEKPHPGEIKPEITQSMIEVSTGIHNSHETLLGELRKIRTSLVNEARVLNVGVSGGGAHPFQHWSDRRIFDRPRFRHVSDLYGYLAKQFTVFGQHIHIGCNTGNNALYLLHSMARYIPHLIALSSCSPYYQGVDTAFDSSRLNSVFAFPLSGRAPFLLQWSEFERYFERMRSAGIVESMKDFYWDIRPKPEYGTIEIRICDTPLTVDRAATLAVYVQTLCKWLMTNGPRALTEEIYLAYTFNRFQACRFGMEGELVDVATGTRRTIGEDILATTDVLRKASGNETGLYEVEEIVKNGNEARWMREQYAINRSLPDLMWRQVERFRGEEE
jgi:carboxylate-amine ligase